MPVSSIPVFKTFPFSEQNKDSWLIEPCNAVSNGSIYSYGMYNYGIYTYDLYRYGLHSYGMGKHDLYSYGIYSWVIEPCNAVSNGSHRPVTHRLWHGI